MELLNIAAAEGRRALEVVKHQQPSPQSYNDSYQAVVVSKALDAAEELLLATQQTDSLSPIVANHHQHPSEEPPVLLQVTILHRAFLTLTQWCLVLATNDRPQQQQQNTDSESSSSPPSPLLLLLDNPLLEVALKLTARAQELSLPFHLPLYQRLVTTLAEHSLDPIPNILNIAHGAASSFEFLPVTFFSGALVQLTQRQRLVDVVHLLQAMKTVHHMDLVERDTTKEILVLLKPHFNKGWIDDSAPDPESSPMISTVEQDAVQVVLLLESSIWNLLNNNNGADKDNDDTGMLEDATLKEAVGAIIRVEEEARQDAAHRQTLRDMLVEDPFSDDEDDDDDDDDDDLDDDEFQNFQDYTPNTSQERAFKDWMQAMANGGGELPRNMQIKIHRSGEETIMQVTGMMPEDEDDSDEGEHPHEREMASLIYTRAHGYRDFPDVAAQVYEANGGLELLYSREFERHVIEQLDPGPDDDYDDI